MGQTTYLFSYKWKSVGDAGIESLKTTTNELMITGMHSSWWYSEISTTQKGKGSVMECGNCRDINIMSHTMKLFERKIENRIREIVELGNIQFGNEGR